MSIEFFLRIIGMVVLVVVGGFLGIRLADLAEVPREQWASLFASLGALTGLILTPYLTTRPLRALRRNLSLLPATTLSAAMIGLVVGLIVGALASLPLSLLPAPFGNLLPVLGALFSCYLGVTLFVVRRDDLFAVFGGKFSGSAPALEERTILLDTSVIIDGRIADVAATGFLQSTMLVPRFVLNELQYIADSSEPIRHQRGRRGLEVLNRLRKDTRTPLRVTDLDVEEIHSTDEKLIVLAKQLHCPILTNDYNLNRVAELQGVVVLNLNDLANAIRVIFLPGETLPVYLIQEGKEPGQGVGYLEDGTMVVVDEGRRFLDRTVTVVVTKVLQTSAGRMIFARIDNSAPVQGKPH
ncbi:MAG: PIN domain-containing protein [Anaerolineales bacterium]|nr:PIN domain-containing protein [Anaerolineales bacterium]